MFRWWRIRKEAAVRLAELAEWSARPHGEPGDQEIRLSRLGVTKTYGGDHRGHDGLVEEQRQWVDLRRIRIYGDQKLLACFQAYLISGRHCSLYWAIEPACWVMHWNRQYRGPKDRYDAEQLLLRSETLEGLAELLTEMDLVDREVMLTFGEIGKTWLFERPLPKEAVTYLERSAYKEST